MVVDGSGHVGSALAGERAFPVTPRDSLEAGLTVMAMDEAAATGRMVDLAPMWAKLDAAMKTAA